MEPETKELQLMECLIHVVGRLAIPVEEVIKTVGRKDRYLKAFNLCDGGYSQKEIAKKVGIKQSNLSKACKRWVADGVAFWIGEGRDTRLLHIYAIPKTAVNRERAPKKRSRRKHVR